MGRISYFHRNSSFSHRPIFFDRCINEFRDRPGEADSQAVQCYQGMGMIEQWMVSQMTCESCNWNLTDNNLDNQSDECKKFLIKLLVK